LGEREISFISTLKRVAPYCVYEIHFQKNLEHGPSRGLLRSFFGLLFAFTARLFWDLYFSPLTTHILKILCLPNSNPEVERVLREEEEGCRAKGENS